MPHSWISSDYIRAALDMFVHPREADQSLVLAAGVPAAWFDEPGISVRNLRTPHGVLDYSIVKTGNRVVLEITRGARPPGGFVFPWPWDQPPGPARINGKPLPWHGNELQFTDLPAEIVIQGP
jgi:hypothetical protein